MWHFAQILPKNSQTSPLTSYWAYCVGLLSLLFSINIKWRYYRTTQCNVRPKTRGTAMRSIVLRYCNFELSDIFFSCIHFQVFLDFGLLCCRWDEVSSVPCNTIAHWPIRFFRVHTYNISYIVHNKENMMYVYANNRIMKYSKPLLRSAIIESAGSIAWKNWLL